MMLLGYPIVDSISCSAVTDRCHNVQVLGVVFLAQRLNVNTATNTKNRKCNHTSQNEVDIKSIYV